MMVHHKASAYVCQIRKSVERKQPRGKIPDCLCRDETSYQSINNQLYLTWSVGAAKNTAEFDYCKLGYGWAKIDKMELIKIKKIFTTPVIKGI